MKRTCPIVLDDCSGADSPITNLSSEAPDPLLFAGYGWSPYNPYKIQKLGAGVVSDEDCSNITWSTVSQEIADLFAWLNALYCTEPEPTPDVPPWTPPPFPEIPPLPPIPPALDTDFTLTPPPETFPGLDLQQFGNDRQTVSVNCPDGSVFTLAIEAGTVLSPAIPLAEGPAWVAYINAHLLAYLLQRIIDLKVCMTPPDPPQIPELPGPPPSGGGRSSPAGSLLSDNPAWICSGDTLNWDVCKYSVTGSQEYTFAVTAGTLPPGVTLVQADGRTAYLIGDPGTPGVYPFTVTATQVSYPYSTVSVADVLNVMGITNPALPDGEVGTAYSAQLLTAGGVAPFTFELVGTLPDGLTMNSAGLITGTPTTVTP